jgi:acylphosphatase
VRREAPVVSNAKMEQSARHVIFVGHVQGVGFRFTAHRIAVRHQLAGFVRNLPDGTVEMLAQGRPEDIDDYLRDMKESFTGYLRETQIREIPFDPRYTDFKITF